MNFRNISSWCIKNPVPPIVLFVGLMLAGLVTFSRMEVNNNPDIDFPAAQINISQPGAAPTEMENQITQKVEAAARSVNGVDEINSTVREGNSNTFVQFKIGTPTDRAVNPQERMQLLVQLGQLRQGVDNHRAGMSKGAANNPGGQLAATRNGLERHAATSQAFADRITRNVVDRGDSGAGFDERSRTHRSDCLGIRGRGPVQDHLADRRYVLSFSEPR